jgi:hypothetical protein
MLPIGWSWLNSIWRWLRRTWALRDGHLAYLWDLFGENDARKAMDDAQQCMRVAEGVYKHYFG